MTWPDSPPTEPPARPPTAPMMTSPSSSSSEVTSPGRPGPRRRAGGARTALGVILVFLAGLSATFGVASFWTARSLLDADTWVATSKAIVNDPEVQNDVAQALATQIVTVVGVDDLVKGVLPGPLSGFSGTVTEKVTALITVATEQVVRTDAFIRVWESAVRATHDQFVHAVDGSGGAITLGADGLYLDLGGSLAEIDKQLDQRGINVLDAIDPSSIDLQILLVDAPGLERVRTWVRVLRVGAIVFPAVAVIAAVAGLLFARRRSFAVIAGGIGAIAGAAIVAFVSSSGRDRAIEHISGGVLGPASARVIVDEVTSGLDDALLVTGAVAAVIVLTGIVAAVLTSRGGRAGPADVATADS